MAVAFFSNYVYESDNTVSYRLRLSDTAFAAHPSPKPEPGPTDTGVSANVSGNRNVAGMHVRGLRLSRTTGTGAARKTFSTFLPIANPTAYNATSVGDSITIGGVAYTVASKVPEQAR